MSELINLDTLFAATQTGAGANVLLREELTAHRQFTGAWPAVTTAIVRDTLTPTRAYTVVETEGGVATDILGLISPASTHDGMEIKLIAQDSRTITVRHQPTVTNGITLAGGADITLSTSRFLFLKRFGDRWREIVTESLPFATDARLIAGNTREVVNAAQLANTNTNITTLNSRTISTTAPLTGGGNLSANRTLSITAASTSASGAVQLATNAEVQAGTDATKAVTSASLVSRTATTARTGLAQLATVAEAQTGTDATKIVTPAGLAGALSTFSKSGHAWATSSQNWSVPYTGTYHFLLMGGGGGGGGRHGGSASSAGGTGGAGGISFLTKYLVQGTNVSISIGGGGAGGYDLSTASSGGTTGVSADSSYVYAPGGAGGGPNGANGSAGANSYMRPFGYGAGGTGAAYSQTVSPASGGAGTAGAVYIAW